MRTGIRSLGLIGGAAGDIVRSGLVHHLDIADPTSWPGSGNLWIDLGSLAIDFYRGGSGVGDAAEPSANAGPPGYWGFDGGDYFSPRDTTAGSLLRRIGRQDTAFTVELFGWSGAVGLVNYFWSNTYASSDNGAGFGPSVTDGTSKLQFVAYPLGTKVEGAATLNNNTWYQMAVAGRCDGAVTIQPYLNGAPDGAGGTRNNASWASGDSTRDVAIGAAGNLANALPNGSRLAILRIYDRALSGAEILQNFGADRGRFGI